MPGAICLIVCPLPNSSFEQWRTAVIVTGYTLFVTSQYDDIFAFSKPAFGEVCWYNMHIMLHALSLLVVIQCVTVMTIIISAQSWSPERNRPLNATTEQNRRQKINKGALRLSGWPWRSCRGTWHLNLTKIPLVCSVSCFNLGGLELCLGG